MEEAVLTEWHLEVGETVTAGKPIADVETEKATVEYLAEASGVLAKLLVETGAPIAVGTPIAIIATGDESVEEALAASNGGSDGVPSRDGVSTTSPQDKLGTVELVEGQPVWLRASPLVRRLARTSGVDLSALEGTGPQGRIVRRDLDRHAATVAEYSRTQHVASAAAPATEAAAIAPQQPVAADPGTTDVPHTGMRRAIARRLTESKSTVPHFYISADVRVDALLELRKSLNAEGHTFSLNDFIVKAVGGALKDVPEMNATWLPDAIRRHERVDIAVAVALEDGLVTPVLRNVAGRSLSSLSDESRDLVDRARRGALKQHELEGGTFTVSNLGMFGTERFSAIINPPHSGILAVGAATARPVVIDGQLAVGTMMTITLSGDHRVADGADGAKWLAALAARLENPLRILA